MPSLDQVRIAGFKSIRDQTVELRPLNVLIGANGSGKSNFISVFRLLHEIVNGNLAVFVGQQGGADRLLHFGRKVTDELQLEFEFGRHAYRIVLKPAARDDFVFSQETVSFHNPAFPEPYTADLGGGRRESLLERASSRSDHRYSGPAADVLQAMDTWRVYHFHDTSSSARIKQTGDLSDNVQLRADARNLAAFLYRLQETDPGAFANIVGTVRMVAPFFDRFELRPDRLNPEKIRLEWRERGSDAYFDGNSLSDGTLRFIALATLLLQPEPPTLIVIDEPELGLHPYAIQVLAQLLSSAAERTQLVVSTQSVTLVNQLAPEDILIVDREGPESIFRRPTQQQIESWLDDYALGELWEKNVLGGRPSA
jgi:predicted ATPase